MLNRFVHLQSVCYSAISDVIGRNLTEIDTVVSTEDISEISGQ